jgi:hypothetical protein
MRNHGSRVRIQFANGTDVVRPTCQFFTSGDAVGAARRGSQIVEDSEEFRGLILGGLSHTMPSSRKLPE